MGNGASSNMLGRQARVLVLAVIAMPFAAACGGGAARTWLPAVGVIGTLTRREARAQHWAVDARLVATWGGGEPFPPPLDHVTAHARGGAWRTHDAPCISAALCTWERQARALAARTQLARVGRRRR